MINRLAFKQEFMETPGGDDPKVHYPIDFQLKWDKHGKLFAGNFYIQTADGDDKPISGLVVLFKDKQ